MDESQEMIIEKLSKDIIRFLSESFYGHAGRPGVGVGGSTPRGEGGVSNKKEAWQMTRDEFYKNYAFHATKSENIPSIVKNGVTKGSWATGSVMGFPGDKLLIVHQSELTKRGATPSKFGPWNLLEPEGTRARKYKDKIPIDKITIIDKTNNPHELLVRQALSDGKSVPEKVLKDYPHLQKKQAKTESLSREIINQLFEGNLYGVT